MHNLCHYGYDFLTEMFGTTRRRVQQAVAQPVAELGPITSDYELVGNHTITIASKYIHPTPFKPSTLPEGPCVMH